MGTINVVQACLKHNVERLLYASSVTVYGNPSKMPVKETDLAKPVSYYGISKYAAENFVHATCVRTDLSNPLNATSFRMFNVYGSR